MPIGFPPQLQGPFWTDPALLFQVPGNYDLTNLAFPGEDFSLETMTKRIHGGAQKGTTNNVVNLGVQYQNVTEYSRVNPVPAPAVNQAFSVRQLGWGRVALVGVTRDSAGVALGDCTVYIFKDGLQEFVGETVSDAGGNWTFYLSTSGPFWIRAYKVAALAGTSDNGLVPDVV